MDVEITGTVTDEAAEQLKKNIMFFCNTPKGSLPQMRGYGLDPTIMDEPFATLRMRATVDIVSGLRQYYGIQVSSINVTADENGGVKVKIEI